MDETMQDNSYIALMFGDNDEKVFFPKELALESVTIKESMGDSEVEVNEVPIAQADGLSVQTLKHIRHLLDLRSKGYEFMTENGILHRELEGYDIEYIYDLIKTVNFLNIPFLLSDLCKYVAFLAKGKTPEEMRQIFKIKNDLTPEQEEQIRKENEQFEKM